MGNLFEATKKLIGIQIQKSVLKQKNEWPATSTPIFFQPERPQIVKNLDKSAERD